MPDRILAVTIENVGSVTLEELPIDGATVTRIEGANGTGKSSCIDALALCLFGPDAVANPVPVRRGASVARVTTTTKEMTIERSLAADGRTRLVIKGPRGEVYPGPVAMLKSRIASVCVDPLAFGAMKPAERAATLRQLAGIDVSEFERDEASAYDERRLLKKRLDDVDAQLAALPPARSAAVSAAPDPAAAVAELREAERQNRANEDDRGRQAELHNRIEALKHELREAEGKLEQQTIIVGLNGPLTDLAPLEAAVTAANQAVRDRAQTESRDRLAAEQAKLTRDVAAQQETIEACRAAKLATLETAAWPLPGLSVEGDVVMWGDLPLASAETAVQLRVGAAIGFAASPELKAILIRQGSLLDPASLQALREVAEQHGGQIILERVADGPLTVIVEDGAALPVGADRPAPATAASVELMDL